MAKKLNQTSRIDNDSILIVRELSNGKTISEISDRLVLKKRTLEDKILRLRVQFNCRNVAHLVSFFLREKLIK